MTCRTQASPPPISQGPQVVTAHGVRDLVEVIAVYDAWVRKSPAPDPWDALIRLLIEKAKTMNAAFARMDNHKCAAYDGWCVEVTVKKHEVECE